MDKITLCGKTTDNVEGLSFGQVERIFGEVSIFLRNIHFWRNNHLYRNIHNRKIFTFGEIFAFGQVERMELERLRLEVAQLRLGAHRSN